MLLKINFACGIRNQPLKFDQKRPAIVLRRSAQERIHGKRKMKFSLTTT